MHSLHHCAENCCSAAIDALAVMVISAFACDNQILFTFIPYPFRQSIRGMGRNKGQVQLHLQLRCSSRVRFSLKSLCVPDAISKFPRCLFVYRIPCNRVSQWKCSLYSGVDFKKIKYVGINGKVVNVQMCDATGHERFVVRNEFTDVLALSVCCAATLSLPSLGCQKTAMTRVQFMH